MMTNTNEENQDCLQECGAINVQWGVVWGR